MDKRFDVFLSHNSKEPAVRELAEALRARGLKVWLGEWELVPGRPWQETLEEVIETTGSSIVLVGKDGLGPWQDAEMRGCLSEFVERKLPVIPVLLPGAPEVPKLPFFLKRFTWVDLREGLTEEGIDRLQWGVTGKRPAALTRNNLNEPPDSLAVEGQLVLPPQGFQLGSSSPQSSERGALVKPPPVGMAPPPLPLPPETFASPPISAAPHVTRPTVARKGPLVSPGRTVIAASVAALLLLAVAATLFGWIWSTTPESGRDAREDDQQKQVVELVQTGYRYLKASDPATAAQAFRQAEEIAPEKQRQQLRNARMMAEKQAAEFGELVERQKLVVDHLMAAQQAMDNRRFEEALVSADAALALDPGSISAQEIRNTAQTAQTHLREQQAKKRQDQFTVPEEKITSNITASKPESLPTAVAEKPVPQTASLHISFQSDMRGIATVIVQVDGENKLQTRVGERGGPLRRASGGRADRIVELIAGDAEIKVWVTPPGGKPELFTRTGNFLIGSSRSLDIRLSAAGQASASLK